MYSTTPKILVIKYVFTKVKKDTIASVTICMNSAKFFETPS